uniref:Uncharacterized protein n=1 Tax=Timema cristinae TaxID=61476 RepID=A0A7R9GVH5_TIMCR|nr:unnamed protein product [Timema cristinae]
MSNRGIAVGQTIGDSLFVEGTSSRLCDGETAVVSDADNSISSNGKKCGTLETRTTTTLRRLGDYPEHSKRCFACKQRTLLHYRDMPPHLQFNPYIFTGYRPLLTFWGSIHSLFYLHNETINILTHGEFPIGFVSHVRKERSVKSLGLVSIITYSVTLESSLPH